MKLKFFVFLLKNIVNQLYWKHQMIFWICNIFTCSFYFITLRFSCRISWMIISSLIIKKVQKTDHKRSVFAPFKMLKLKKKASLWELKPVAWENPVSEEFIKNSEFLTILHGHLNIKSILFVYVYLHRNNKRSSAYVSECELYLWSACVDMYVCEGFPSQQVCWSYFSVSVSWLTSTLDSNYDKTLATCCLLL